MIVISKIQTLNANCLKIQFGVGICTTKVLFSLGRLIVESLLVVSFLYFCDGLNTVIVLIYHYWVVASMYSVFVFRRLLRCVSGYFLDGERRKYFLSESIESGGGLLCSSFLVCWFPRRSKTMFQKRITKNIKSV